MENNNNNVWGWVIGIIVVVLVALGIWWYVSANPTTGSDMASTTDEMATTTDTAGSDVTTPVTSEDRSTLGVAAVVASLPDGSTFSSYLNATGVAASLTGTGPFTVFVPTNEAFAALPAGTISNLTAAQEKRLVQYHVVATKQLDIDALSSGTYTALSKDTLNFNVNLTYKEAFINSGYAITEYKAKNGIVYLISNVLIPPQTPATSTGSTGTPHP